MKAIHSQPLFTDLTCPKKPGIFFPPEHLQPEFIRLPKAGEICPVTGLPRTTLIELLQRAGKAVPVRHIRQPGATTGIALIPRQKLVDYIHGLPVPEWQEDESNENAD